MTALNEPTNIGLSEKAHALLKRLKDDQHFLEMADAYRFGIALALASGVVPDEAPPPRTTIFGVGTIDPEREIAAAIRLLMDTAGVPIYKWAERLAEWGITELSIRAESGVLDLSEIVASISINAEQPDA